MYKLNKKDSENYAIWIDKERFELAQYYINAINIIKKAKKNNSSKDDIINQFDELQLKHNDLTKNGSGKFFNENLTKIFNKQFQIDRYVECHL